MRTQYIGPDKSVGQVDRRAGRERTNQKLYKGDRALVGLQQVPAPIDDHCRIRLLLVEHVVECLAHGRQRVRAEIRRRPNGSETSRKQQLVGLTEWDVKGFR